MCETSTSCYIYSRFDKWICILINNIKEAAVLLASVNIIGSQGWLVWSLDEAEVLFLCDRGAVSLALIPVIICHSPLIQISCEQLVKSVTWENIGDYWLVIQESQLGTPTAEIWPKMCWSRCKTPNKQTSEVNS